MQGKLHSLETFGAVDGPGIRTVFFMQGCPARCAYCHNPDTWETAGGTEIDIEYVVNKALRGRPYYGDDGGVTFSGGEPLLQGEFLAEAIDALHEKGISVAVDTSGTYLDDYSESVIKRADLILLDIKHTDPKSFFEVTARKQDTLPELIALINKYKRHVWIRQVVLPGFNDTDEYMASLKEFLRRVDFVDKVELLGYHDMGKNKYEKLGMSYRLENLKPMDKEKLAELQAYINE